MSDSKSLRRNTSDTSPISLYSIPELKFSTVDMSATIPYIEKEPPYIEKNDSSRTLERVATVSEEFTNEELDLLRKIRTIRGPAYEAQYFDTNPAPRKDLVSRMGNPTTLALAVLAVLNAMMALFLMGARSVQKLNFLVGMMWFTGGVTIWIVAIFELLVGNTFAWTLFGMLGGYFFSNAALFTPAFGVADAYKDAAPEMLNALALFNVCYAILFLLFLVCSLKTNIFFCWILVCVTFTCGFQAIGGFLAADGHVKANAALTKVAGVFLFLSSIPGWYLLFLSLTASAGWPLAARLPTGDIESLKRSVDHDVNVKKE